MTVFVPEASLPVLVIGISGLLLSLYLITGFLSRKRQHDAVRGFQEYFNLTVCPRSEFAPHLRELPLNSGPLRAGTLPQEGPFCPEAWVKREAEERSSPYYLRTGQQISVQAAMEPVGSWYGLEAWIRDLLAARGDLLHLAWSRVKGQVKE